MYRLVVTLAALALLTSCSMKTVETPPVQIPDNINGTVLEIDIVPTDINTPKNGSMVIAMVTDGYRIDFTVTDSASADATLSFSTDSILSSDSREFAFLGQNVVGYQPLKDNRIEFTYKNGKRIFGQFNLDTHLQGEFGETLIKEWRDPRDPAKPNDKAKTDIMGFMNRYEDKDGSGPETSPTYLSLKISKI